MCQVSPGGPDKGGNCKVESRKMNLILIGYRGTGKSTVGKIVAEMLNFKRIETDAEITDRAGMSIPEIVKENSWNYFRDLESEVVSEACSMENTVIDCGGGVVTRPENVKALKRSGIIFLLKADINDILRRISSSSQRPSLTGDKSFTVEVEQVLKEREPLYQAAADYIIDTSSESPRTAGKKIAQIYRKLTDSGSS